MRGVPLTHRCGRNYPESKPRAREGVKVANLIDALTKNEVLTNVAHARAARLTVLKFVDRDLQSLTSLMTVYLFSSQVTVDEVLANIFRCIWCVVLWSISVPSNL